MERVYYIHTTLPEPTGDHLETYLDFFSPETGHDRVLMRAAVLTLFWGGRPGNRPAFLLTGPDRDLLQGRGVGKSKFIDITAEGLCGGYIDVNKNDNISDVKTRLLSPEARQARVCRLDNLKTLRFSWADLEGLITAGTVSGRMLYRGEGQRPNTLTWFITLNGAALSKDMVQRVIPIKLARPSAPAASWEYEVRGFVAVHRAEIIADVLSRLEVPGIPTEGVGRWVDWERSVLAHAADPDELEACQSLIVKRQRAIDDDDHERALVAATFRDGVGSAAVGDPDVIKVFVPSAFAGRWLDEATGERRPIGRTLTYVLGLGIPELSRATNNGYHGLVWKGQECPKKSKLKHPFPKKMSV